MSDLSDLWLNKYPIHPMKQDLAIFTRRAFTYETEVQYTGDPETPEDFARAAAYLEAITNTLTDKLILEVPTWHMQPDEVTAGLTQEIVAKLDDHNAWPHYEVEQEQKRIGHQCIKQ